MNSLESATPSTSSSDVPSNTTTAASTDEPNYGASAQKVSEVFASAGQAFQKLSELITHIQNQTKNGNDRKWTTSDTTNLRIAVSRFVDELQRISNNVQAREVQLMKDDITKRPTASRYVRASSPRANDSVSSSSTRSGATLVRPLVKRTGSVPQLSVDAGVKRRIIASTSGATLFSNIANSASAIHVQPPNISSSNIFRRKSGTLSAVPSAITTVTVQSSTTPTVLTSESSTNKPPNNSGDLLLSNHDDQSTYAVISSGRV